MADSSKSKQQQDLRRSAGGARGKKRRWFRRLVIMVLLLLVIIGAAPYLMATNFSTGLIVKAVNQRSDFRIELEELSLTWRGPMVMRGLQVWDGQGRQVLHLEGAVLAQSFWGLLTSTGDFGEALLYGLKITAYQSEEPKEIWPIEWSLPQPRGRVDIRQGQLRVVRPDGSIEEISEIEGAFDIDTLDKIQGELQLSMYGGKVRGEIDLEQLYASGRLDPETLAGTVKLTTEENLDLETLLSVVQLQTSVTGQVQIMLEGRYQQGQISADITTELKDLRDNRAEPGGIKPLDVSFVGHLKTNGEQLEGEGDLSSAAGTVSARFSYAWAESFEETFEIDLMDVILNGSVVALPEFAVEMKGSINLPVLSQAAPALLKIREDIRITRGKLQINEFNGKGGSTPQLSGNVQLVDLAAEREEQVLTVDPVTVDYNIGLEPGVGLNINRADISSDFARVSVRGAINNITGELSADLNQWHRQMSEIFDLPAWELKGQVDGTFILKKASQEIPLVSTGQVKIQGFSLDNNPLGDEDIIVNWSGMQIHSDLSLIKVALAEVSGESVNLKGERIQYQDYPERRFGGQVELRADLRRWREVAALFLEKEYQAELAGQLTWAGACQTTGDVVRFTGSGAIDGFQFGLGNMVVQEERVELVHDTELDRQEEVLQLIQTQITSPMLSVQIGGTVREYKSICLLDLQGNYEGSWERITKVLHGIFPQAAQLIEVQGVSASDFIITGAARRENMYPTFYDLTSRWDIEWESVEIFGVTLGPAILAPQLNEGQILVPLTSVAAKGGKVNLAGMVDWRGDEPRWRLTEEIRIVENVAVDAEMGRQYLSYVNPIFAQMSQISGRVTMVMTNLDIPLTEEITTRATGDGIFDLTQVQVQSTGMLGAIMELIGLNRGQLQPMRVENARFTIREGRIFYDDFRVILAQTYDLKFYGSVGFDDTLDLVVSLPIVPDLLENLGLKNPVKDITQLLTGARLDIPISGTRMMPVLDLSRVDLESLLKYTIETPVKGVQTIIENIFKIIIKNTQQYRL